MKKTVSNCGACIVFGANPQPQKHQPLCSILLPVFLAKREEKLEKEGGGRVKGGFHFEITVGPSQPLSSRSECGGDMMVQSKCGRGKGRPYLYLPSAEAAKRGGKKKGGSSEEI